MKRFLGTIFLSTLFTFSASAESSLDLTQFRFLNFYESDWIPSTSEEALKKLDSRILEASAQLPSETADQIIATYKAVIEGRMALEPQQVSSLVYSQFRVTPSWGGVEIVLTEKPTTVSHFRMFLKNELKDLPVLLRRTAIHEIAGHLINNLMLHNRFGATESVKYFDDETESGLAYHKLTHATAGLMETQYYRMIPIEILEQDIDRGPWNEKTKAFFKEYWRKLYAMDNRDLIKELARSEACPKGQPKCISDEEFQTFFSYWKEIGINMLTQQKEIL